MGETLHAAAVARVFSPVDALWESGNEKKKKTLLKKTHIKARLKFAKRHMGDSMCLHGKVE